MCPGRWGVLRLLECAGGRGYMGEGMEGEGKRIRTCDAVRSKVDDRAVRGVLERRVQAPPLEEANACGRFAADSAQAPAGLSALGLSRRASRRFSMPWVAAPRLALLFLGLSGLHRACSHGDGRKSTASGDLSPLFAAPNWTMYHTG